MRYRMNGRARKGDGDGDGDGRPSSSSKKKRSYPAFPAKALLGITINRKTTTTSTASTTPKLESGTKEEGVIIQQSPQQQQQATPAVDIVEPPYDLSDFRYEKHGRNRTLLYWEEVVAAIEQTQDVLDESDENSLLMPHNNNNNNNDSSIILDLWTNISTWGPCYPRALSAAATRSGDDDRHRLLRAKKKKKGSQSQQQHNGARSSNWTYIVQSNSDRIMDEDSIGYPNSKSLYNPRTPLEESLGGLCRPGFLIIGQGKCGTSSLYHYLTGHPRILPAREKQIHYFRYHKSKPLPWYYGHFPTTESFLGRGALMTGEASPGYMPYPSVVESVAKKLSPDWRPPPPSSSSGSSSNNGEGGDDDGGGVRAWREHVRSLPKIIAVVRNPIHRAISSYKYNYVEPALKKLRSGGGISASGMPIPRRKSEAYYREHHLFTFEELAYAELAALRECLAPGGRGERYSARTFGKRPGLFFYDSVQRRNRRDDDDNGDDGSSIANINNASSVASESESPPPLVHLDGACYVETKSEAVPRTQWRDLALEHPDKVLQLPNLQLVQSIIGRGVYALPLEWWYEVFSNANFAANAANREEHIHVVCTEDMADAPERAMEDVTEFLGLPEFDFANVTSVGRYNVGGHRGYDTITKQPLHDDDADDVDETMSEEDGALPDEGHFPKAPDDDGADDDLLAISDALMNDLVAFYRPYNQRLFKMIGKQCPWK